MSAIIKCDCCGAVVPYTKALHVRIYPLNSATTYKADSVKEYLDMCNGCYKRFKEILRQEALTDAK